MHQTIHSLIALLLMTSLTPLAAAETVAISAASTELAVNSTVQVTVTVSGTAPFAVWGQSLRWDSAKLALVSQDTSLTTGLGQVVPDSRSTTEINASQETRTGGYHLAGSTYSNNGGGNGSIARFTFTRLTAGSTTVTVDPKAAPDHPFGLVLINAAATERSISAPATLTFTDPANAPATPTGSTSTNSSGSSGGGCGLGGGLAVLMLALLAGLGLRPKL